MKRTIETSSRQYTLEKYDPNVHFNPQNQRNLQKQRKSKSHFESSLPHITPFASDIKNVKINLIRKQNDQTEEQIVFMKGRINALKQMKKKIQIQKQKSLEKLEFIHTVRQRKKFQSLHKLREKQKQNKELEDLKEKARILRQGTKRQLKKAKQTIYLKNYAAAYEKKEIQEGNSEQILKKQLNEQRQKAAKVERIKKEQRKHLQKMRQFQKSQIIQSKKNRASRIQMQLKEKLSKQKSLEKLRKQYEQYLEQLKMAQKQYKQTIKKINPEIELIGKGSRVSLIDKTFF